MSRIKDLRPGGMGPVASGLPNPIGSFDARDWARAFVAHVRAIPGLAEDEETMVTWFASALMRGFDEAINTEIRKEF